ncbi:MAG: hypothetical protein JXB13_19970 [Phycisphaerae bacterium]|nr:hypothetical protein [Phycisphaerae bacterium]
MKPGRIPRAAGERKKMRWKIAVALRFFHLISCAVLRTRLIGGNPRLHLPWRVPETGFTSPQVGYARYFAAFFLRFFAAFFAFLAPFFLAALRFFAMDITSFLIANGSRPKKTVKKNPANCLQFCIGRFPPISSVFAPRGGVGVPRDPGNRILRACDFVHEKVSTYGVARIVCLIPACGRKHTAGNAAGCATPASAPS